MTITLYGIKQCDTCRKARKYLENVGVKARFVDLRADAVDDTGRLDARLLDHFMAQADWSALVNKRSTTWRQLPPEAREPLDKQRAYTLLRQHPTLLKRPLLDTGKTILVGFDAKQYDAL